MTAQADYKNQALFMLAGGLYSGLILLFMSVLTNDPNVRVPLGMWAAAQLVYGFFEMKYRMTLSDRSYKIGRYSIYIVVNLVVFVIFYVSGVVK